MQSTNCLWVGGLSETTRKSELMREFEYFAEQAEQRSFSRHHYDNPSKKIEIDWKQNETFAYIMFSTISEAEDARHGMKGKALPNNSSDRLRIDYADPKKFKAPRPVAPEPIDNKKSSKPRKPRSKSRSTSPDNKQSTPPLPPQSTPSKNEDIRRSFTDVRSRLESPKPVDVKKSSPPTQEEQSRGFNQMETIIITTTRADNTRRVDTALNLDPKRKKKKSRRSSSPQDEDTDTSEVKNEAQKRARSTSKTRKTDTRIVEETSPVESSETSKSGTKSKQSNGHHHRHNHTKRPNKEQEVPGVIPGHHEDRDEGEINEDEEPVTKPSEITIKKIEPPSSNSSNEEARSKKQKTNPETYTPDCKLIKETMINKKLINNRLKSIDSIPSLSEECWSGVFTLKKHLFPTKFYLLSGSKSLAEQILPRANNTLNYGNLRISQRLRLDPAKLDELERKFFDSNYLTSSKEITYALMVAIASEINLDGVQHQQKTLGNLIGYLDQKSAAGVIPLPDDERPCATINAFTPSCPITIRLLKQALPDAVNSSFNDFIVIILNKHASSHIPPAPASSLPNKLSSQVSTS